MLGAILLALLVAAPTALALCCVVSFGARFDGDGDGGAT